MDSFFKDSPIQCWLWNPCNPRPLGQRFPAPFECLSGLFLKAFRWGWFKTIRFKSIPNTGRFVGGKSLLFSVKDTYVALLTGIPNPSVPSTMSFADPRTPDNIVKVFAVIRSPKILPSIIRLALIYVVNFFRDFSRHPQKSQSVGIVPFAMNRYLPISVSSIIPRHLPDTALRGAIHAPSKNSTMWLVV